MPIRDEARTLMIAVSLALAAFPHPLREPIHVDGDHACTTTTSRNPAAAATGQSRDAGSPRGNPTSSSAHAIDAAAQKAGATETWWGTVSAALQREEYNASVGAQGLQAPNRAQNLRTYFRPQGIEVVPRTNKGTEAAWRFALRTSRWGRPDRLEPFPEAESEPQFDGPRVTYERPGMIEWYENGKEGLEQGFIVNRRPTGDGPLCIREEAEGSLHAEYRSEEGAVDFQNAQGASLLRYGRLHARDAAGRDLTARLECSGGEVAILIEDAGATYPLRIDPVLTSPSWRAEADQANAEFGFSVATAGDVNGDGYSDVIVGIPAYDGAQVDEGRAWAYLGSPGGLSTHPLWTALSDQAGAELGYSVATAGDVNGDGYSDVIIGSPSHDSAQVDAGRAAVYLGSSNGLSMTPAWTVNGDQTSENLGFSVGAAGDVNADGYPDVIVGAPYFSTAQSYVGRVYVFGGGPAGPGANPMWTADGQQVGGRFGSSVGTAGDVNGDNYADIIIGAPYYDSPLQDGGKAFVYLGSAAGPGSNPAWTTSSDLGFAYLGFSVATAGDVNGDGYSDVIVGAYNYDGSSGQGRAQVFLGSASGLLTAPAWTIGGTTLLGEFGYSVASAGDVNGDGYADVIVGSPDYNGVGRAYVYQGSANGLSTTPIWTADGDQSATYFGTSVATAGDVNGDGFSDVLVGVPFYTHGETNEGRAYEYNGSPAGPATVSAWTAGGTQSADGIGNAIASAGDVNGDGYSDVIVGASGYDSGQSNVGRVYVYLGSSGGLATSPAWTVDGDQAGEGLGYSVGTAGDVNGDGYSDVIIGAPYYDGPETDEGRAYVYLGSAGGLSSSPAWTAESNQASAYFGSSVGTAGDVNGDGDSDIIVGAPFFDDGLSNQGRAYVYEGSPSGLSTSPAWTAESDRAAAVFGSSVGTAGDVNGDGYSDVIVGAYSYDQGLSDEGRAYVYEGSSNGLGTSPAWTAQGTQAGTYFGWAVGTAGDVNGDGYSDVIVGAPRYSNGPSNLGRAYVYEGSSGGLATSPAWTATGDALDSYLGWSVATAGDVNGDGFSDVILGGPFYGVRNSTGRAWLYLGSSTGPGATAAWIVDGALSGDAYGYSVATAGDVNGDGYSDIIVGADNTNNGLPGEGKVYLYYGNGGDGADRIPRQTRTDGSTPIWLLGKSDSDQAFGIGVVGRTPAGRGSVRLQYEVKPAGTPFNGSGLVTSLWNNTGTPGGSGSIVPLSGLPAGLAANTLYHWRVRTLTDSPFFPRSPWFTLPYNSVTEADVRTSPTSSDVAAGSVVGSSLLLGRVSPNPFGSSTTLSYVLPASGHVRVSVDDVSGREVAVLIDREETAGSHATRWDGRSARGTDSPAGLYFVHLRFAGREEARKIVLAR